MTPTAKAPMPGVTDIVRRRMSVTRGRDTAPELAVRRLLHARGWRYRVNFRPLLELRRTVDVAFTKRRLAVMIDGCFWHGCPEHGRREFRSNVEYWPSKIASNVARDTDTNSRLEALGWIVLRYWEHEDPAKVASRITSVVRGHASNS